METPSFMPKSPVYSPLTSISPPQLHSGSSSPQLSRHTTQSLHKQTMPCMWGTCNDTFSSLSELVDHVNLQHLILPLPGGEFAPLGYPANHMLDTSQLSCQWRDCHIYPSSQSIPGPSSGDHQNAELGILANHLLHDHLGLPTPMHVVRPSQPSNQSGYSSTRNKEAQRQPQEDLQAFAAISESSGQAGSPPSVGHQCSGTHHKCHWVSCRQTFASCDELTAHLTAVHVGAGKAQYECFWEGCNRHGDHGFSSKQKICRHLQVCVPSFTVPLNCLLKDTQRIVAYGPQTLPV